MENDQEMKNRVFDKILNDKCKLSIGRNTIIGQRVVLGPNCEDISIGFGCFIGNDVYIDVKEFSTGDYVTIHHGSVIHGIKTSIGHNCWFGHYTIIDSLAGYTFIGNNVGVGAHSQLWSHMKFGDVLDGCRWCSFRNLTIEDDVWFVGHSIVGPIHAKKKSMLMTGSVIVSDMEENSIYSGSPAKNMTSRFGNQFVVRTIEEKIRIFSSYVNDYRNMGNSVDFIHLADCDGFDSISGKTVFHLETRKYWPVYSEEEYRFIKFMLYEKGKFLPVQINI